MCGMSLDIFFSITFSGYFPMRNLYVSASCGFVLFKPPYLVTKISLVLCPENKSNVLWSILDDEAFRNCWILVLDATTALGQGEQHLRARMNMVSGPDKKLKSNVK